MTPERTTPRLPTLDRRTLVRGAAWSVPAVTLAAAAPAYAVSPPTTCRAAAVVRSSWSITSGSLANSQRNTGWLVRGQYSQTGMVSAAEAQWFTGRTGPGTSNQPNGSFLSFANNASTTGQAVILVRYAFQVTGNASVTVAGVAKLGYGNSGTNPQRTERQMLDVAVVDGSRTVRVAGVAHRRRNGSTYYPATANATTYGQLFRTDEAVATGRTLHTGIQGEHTAQATYSSDEIALTSASSQIRTVFVDYTLTLDRRAGADWVNDDIIINPPTVTVCQ